MTKHSFELGIISAMLEEIHALLPHLKSVSKIIKGKRTYYTGILFDKKVVLVFSRWGKVAAAATTTQLINDYTVKEIIFTGVAGALQPQLQIGDIVIGDKLFQHDLDARPLYKQFEIPILKKEYFRTSNTKPLVLACENFLVQYHDFVEKSASDEFEINDPKIHVGNIASGDQFVSELQTVKKINEKLPNALCVEMEGAAVAQICFEYDIPFSIIRTISDKANNNADIDFPKFSKSIASFYALGILKNYLA